MNMFATHMLALIVLILGSQVVSEESGQSDEVGTRFFLYRDSNSPGLFIPSGVMPDGTGVVQNTAESESPHSGQHCIRSSCQLSEKPWVGVYFLLSGKWQPTTNCNIFEELEGSLGDAVKCRFWARSKDLAIVQFKVGGVLEGTISDSLKFPAAIDPIKLTSDWKMYEMDLTGKDLTSVVGGFMWTCERAHNGEKDISFDLDDVYFTKVKKAVEQ